MKQRTATALLRSCAGHLALALSAIVVVVPAGPSHAQSPDKVTLQLSWLAQGQASALFYGIQQKCFSDRNIELTVQRGYGGLDTVSKIATGAAQFGQVDIGTVITGVSKSNAPIKAVMPLFTDLPLAVGILGGSPIKGMKDMEGKVLAAGPNEGGVLLLPAAMELVGGDAAKIQRTSMEPAALAGSLLQGKVDAILTYTTTAAGINAVAAKAGKSVTSIDFGKELKIYGDVIITSSDIAAKNSWSCRSLRRRRAMRIQERIRQSGSRRAGDGHRIAGDGFRPGADAGQARLGAHFRKRESGPSMGSCSRCPVPGSDGASTKLDEHPCRGSLCPELSIDGPRAAEACRPIQQRRSDSRT